MAAFALLGYLSLFGSGLCGIRNASAAGNARDCETGAPRPQYSVDEVLRHVGEAHARIRSILVELIGTGLDPKTGSSLPSLKRSVIAAKGRCRYGYYATFAPGVPESIDLYRNEVYYDGESLRVLFPVHGYCRLWRMKAMDQASKIRADFYLECLGWWPSDDDSMVPRGKEGVFLRNALEQGHWVVRPWLEAIGSAWCHVIEARERRDKMWLDSSLGFALRRREMSFGMGTGRLARYELSDYRDVQDGIDVPWQVRRTVYTRASLDKDDYVVEKDAISRVLRVEVNEVHPRMFILDAPAGTLIEDRDSGDISQVLGGLGFLDSVVEIAKARAVIGRQAAADRGMRVESPQWHAYSFVSIVAVLGAVSVYLVGRVRKRPE